MKKLEFNPASLSLKIKLYEAFINLIISYKWTNFHKAIRKIYKIYTVSIN